MSEGVKGRAVAPLQGEPAPGLGGPQHQVRTLLPIYSVGVDTGAVLRLLSETSQVYR